ncbi:hypothetical protein [Cyclobacterium sp.]|nr:hypothetical protein [Cyclobacterium sp.]MBD3627473.1 hypothetical protein [Cyclobacterium sp.]
MKYPVPPSLVVDKILEVAESSSWQLRYPVRPDSIPFWDWRSSMSDEQ